MKNDSVSRSVSRKPPGGIWKHPESGRFYWRLQAKHLPENLQKMHTSERAVLPLIPDGMASATRTRKLAEAVQRRMWAEWCKVEPPAATASVESLIRSFQRWNVSTKGSGEKQAKQNARVVRDLCQVHPGAGLDALGHIQTLDANRIEEFLAIVDDRGMSRRTIQAYRNSIHLFCRWLTRRQVLDVNPATYVEVAAPNKMPPRFLADDTRLAFLRKLHAPDCRPALRDAALVALYCGGRLSSIQRLTCEHVLDRGLVIPLSKTGDYCVCPLDSPSVGPELGRIVRRIKGRRRKGPLLEEHNARTWGGWLRDLVEDLPTFGELEGSRAGNGWHLLRATWAVTLARRGATLWEIMAAGGWKSPQIVTRYVNIARAANRLPEKSIGGP
jgi:integrase